MVILLAKGRLKTDKQYRIYTYDSFYDSSVANHLNLVLDDYKTLRFKNGEDVNLDIIKGCVLYGVFRVIDRDPFINNKVDSIDTALRYVERIVNYDQYRTNRDEILVKFYYRYKIASLDEIIANEDAPGASL